MSAPLPDLYFRIRENGAAVFRVDTENRHRRIEMEQIAVVNVKNGEIKPQGERKLSEWLEVMRTRAHPSSNFTYADADGNIVLYYNARIPALPPEAAGVRSPRVRIGRAPPVA